MSNLSIWQWLVGGLAFGAGFTLGAALINGLLGLVGADRKAA